MKKNFPNEMKEIDFQEVHEAQRVPKKLDPRRNTPRHIIIKFPKIEDKERIGFFEDFIYLFLERGEGREKER